MKIKSNLAFVLCMLILISFAPVTGTSAAPNPNESGQLALLAAPNPPANLTVVEEELGTEVDGGKAAHLNWQASSGATSYRVYRSRTLGVYTIDNRIATTSTTSYDDWGKDVAFDTGAQLYYYVVTAVNAQGQESGFSNEVEAVPHEIVGWAGMIFMYMPDDPDMLTNVITDGYVHTLGDPTMVYHAAGEVFIKWLGPSVDVWAQFGLAPKGVGTTVDLTQWTDWRDAQYFSLGLWEADNYRFKYDFLPEQVGEFYFTYRFSTDLGRNWSYVYLDELPYVPDPTNYPVDLLGTFEVQASADTEPPLAPALSITGKTTTTMSFSWSGSSSSDIYAYDLYRTTVASPSPSDWTFVHRTLHTVGGSPYSYTDTGLVAGTTHYYRLAALDTSFNSAYSSTVNDTTVANPITFSLNFSIPAFTPPNASISINLVTEAAPNILGSSIWNSVSGPGSCDFVSHQCTAELTLQENYELRFRFSRGSQATIQTLLDGNTMAIDPSFKVTSSLTSVQRSVANWDDPLVVSYIPSGSYANPAVNPTIFWNQAIASTSTFIVWDQGENGTNIPGTTLTGTFSYNAAKYSLTFIPSPGLMAKWHYAVEASGILDTKGIAQQATATWSFYTDDYHVNLPLIFRK